MGSFASKWPFITRFLKHVFTASVTTVSYLSLGRGGEGWNVWQRTEPPFSTPYTVHLNTWVYYSLFQLWKQFFMLNDEEHSLMSGVGQFAKSIYFCAISVGIFARKQHLKPLWVTGQKRQWPKKSLIKSQLSGSQLKLSLVTRFYFHCLSMGIRKTFNVKHTLSHLADRLNTWLFTKFTRFYLVNFLSVWG